MISKVFQRYVYRGVQRWQLPNGTKNISLKVTLLSLKYI